MTPLIYLLRPSTIMTNNNGERGYPFRIPLKGKKEAIGDPLMSIEKKFDEFDLIIHETPDH